MPDHVHLSPDDVLREYGITTETDGCLWQELPEVERVLSRGVSDKTLRKVAAEIAHLRAEIATLRTNLQGEKANADYLSDKLAQAEAKIVALRKDKARYHWLRDNLLTIQLQSMLPDGDGPFRHFIVMRKHRQIVPGSGNVFPTGTSEEFDSALDTAMHAEVPHAR